MDSTILFLSLFFKTSSHNGQRSEEFQNTMFILALKSLLHNCHSTGRQLVRGGQGVIAPHNSAPPATKVVQLIDNPKVSLPCHSII